jgi:hypothetical protein
VPFRLNPRGLRYPQFLPSVLAASSVAPTQHVRQPLQKAEAVGKLLCMPYSILRISVYSRDMIEISQGRVARFLLDGALRNRNDAPMRPTF